MLFFRVLVAAFAVPAVIGALAPTSYTPSGRPIYEAPSGSRVLQNGTDMVVYAPNGTVLHVFENVVGARTSTPTGTGPLRPRQTASVSQVYATMGANDTLQALNASFVVPPPPTTFDSQFMFLSQGITTLDDTGAPATFFGGALQYGGSLVQGGPFYTAAAFLEFLPNGGYLTVTLIGPSAQLNVSDTAGISLTYGGIETFPGEPTFFDYNLVFTGPDADNLPQFGVGQQVLPAIVGFRVEEEGVSEPSDYPTGPLTFKDVQLELTTGFPKKLDWEIDGAAATGIDFKVVKGGSKNAEIKLIFPDDS
ncbi:hypothetical protein HMN09_00285700 [Mycena chlorophos]|uniref:Uncharacterized protein n=1 Tax=Mycena chlorophos TaxID=658473 RepID=A0A8H6WJP4_MYCCL|nr:hypothetical protein HMN09_00285700 [Mycena chlorophos]